MLDLSSALYSMFQRSTMVGGCADSALPKAMVPRTRVANSRRKDLEDSANP